MTMNLDDPTLLSAYLDDELDEPVRLALETSLQTDVRLSQRLADLRAVSNLLAAMDRPVLDRDLVGPVVRRLEAPSARRPAISRTRILTLGAALSTAACLVVGLTALISSLPVASTKPVLVIGPGPRPDPAEDAKMPIEPDPAPPMLAIDEAIPNVSGPDELERLGERARRRVLGWLDRPGVRRLIVLADALGPATAEVDELIRMTPRQRPDYGKLPVDQGIVIDPGQPNPAVVFVVRMDRQELGYLRGRIASRPALDVGEVESASPSIVTMLSDLGRVDNLEGTTAVVFTPPPPEVPPIVANKGHLDPDSSNPRRDRTEAATPRTKAPSNTPTTVLVWVTTP